MAGNGLRVAYKYEFKGRGSPSLFPELERHVSNFKCVGTLYEDTLMKMYFDPYYKFPRLSRGQFTNIHVQA